MDDLDDTGNDIKTEPKSDDGFEAHSGHNLMAQAARKVKGHRIRPRKPRKKVPQPPSGPARMPNDGLFMKLAPELGNVIYELVIEDYRTPALRKIALWGYTTHLPTTEGSDTVAGRSRRERITEFAPQRRICVNSNQWSEPGLLSMSKQVRSEALSLYYSLSSFEVLAYPSQLPGLLKMLDRISSNSQLVPDESGSVRSLHIIVLRLRWQDIRHLLPLAQMFMKYRVTISHQGEQIGCKIEAMRQLGLRCIAEEWTEERMAFEFEQSVGEYPEIEAELQGLCSFSNRGRPYLAKRWSELPDCVELPGDTYGTNDEDEKDGDFKRRRRNVSASDRKLRSMS
ncbi:hypothetical protein CBER1_03632 [Cercospora berteroae]|uniref:Uncharacterized protein n=1 Tax=Cercospora berteroae TaxID=357750 RepID=A0A2S6CLP2_9PEZI|nr:hypothetical protein CBER1_03632 [Cercospora berteroae]